MNAFADWLFSVLLGWTGTAANSAWNTIVNASGGISDFFSRFWLPIVVLLIIGGTLLDYGVWMARWKPYLVWRSWLTRRSRQKQLDEASRDLEQTDMDPYTLNTISDWVQTPQDQYPVYDLPLQPDGYHNPYAPAPMTQETWAEEPDFQPVYTEEPTVYDAPYAEEPTPYEVPYTEEAMAPYAPPPHVEEPSPYAAPAVEPYVQPTAEPYVAPEAPPLEDMPPWQTPPPTQPQIPAAPVRRRRSERQRPGAARQLMNTLRSHMTLDDEDETILDELPSPISQQDAFHEPVFPDNYRYQQPIYPQWQQPGEDNHHEPE